MPTDYFVRLHHELVGDLTVVGPPVKFSETELRAARASPVLGAGARSVLTEAGLSESEFAALAEQGHLVLNE